MSLISDHRPRSGIAVGADRASRASLMLTCLGLFGLLLVYAAQTGLGHWQVDEFRYFADHASLGWRAYFERFEVSPRPLSELLIYGYGAMVLAFQRSFVSAALLTIWSTSLLAMAIAAYATARPVGGRLAAAATLALAPMLFTLQVSPVTEMFYWPIATVAYLPMVSAVTILMLLLADEPRTATRRAWCGLVLAVAVLSHEIGAALAIGFAIGAVALNASRPRMERQPVRWWLLPALAGIGVMLGLLLFRSHYVDLGSNTKPYTGRLIASAVVALQQMLIDVVTTGSLPHDTVGVLAALLQKTAFATGFAMIWLRFGSVHPSRWHAMLGVGIAASVYFSLLGAYYHYGDLCCERQASARQWLIELAFILAAAAVLLRWPGRRGLLGSRAAPFGPLLLVASLLPVIAQIPAMRADFEQLSLAGAARFKTWQSGLAPGARMQLYMPPDKPDMLIHGTSMPIGTLNLVTLPYDPANIAAAAGRFFGKSTVDACQAWQTQDSFLINGMFIPACPPHDGPPDRVFNTDADGNPIFEAN